MWVCVSELSASLCVLLCAFSFPPFTPSISLWILSMYFWNNEHRAPLFVFPHQNRARVTEGSSDLVISGFYWVMQPVWIPAGACGWAALAVGWDGSPSTSQGNGLSWFCCWQIRALFAFLFPGFFYYSFFFTSSGCSELSVPWCGYTWNAGCCRGVQGFTHPSPRQSLPRLFPLLSPLIPFLLWPLTSNCCLLIFSLHLFPGPQPP